jgi:hypothetical protein
MEKYSLQQRLIARLAAPALLRSPSLHASAAALWAAPAVHYFAWTEATPAGSIKLGHICINFSSH